jgi:two-component system LytT family sensor kinase
MQPDATLPGPDSRRWRWPRIRWQSAVLLLATFVAVCVLQSLAIQVALRAAGRAVSLPLLLVGNVTGGVSAWMVFPIVQCVVLNANPARGWGRVIAFHLAGYLAFAVSHATVMLGLRWLITPLMPRLSGLVTPAKTQFLWEVQHDLIIYSGLAAFWTLLHAWDERRAAALRAAQLEARLVSTRLDALASRLDPHFLFNALNTVSAVMYEDLPRTERLLADLGQLLRRVLEPGTPTWSLAEERGHTERYVALLQARFGERLDVQWASDPGLEAARVPRFAIQTLVENAVKHNGDRTGRLVVRIAITEDLGDLSLAVCDDGRGFCDADAAAVAAGAPRGLARLAETLQLLYGAGAALERGRSAQGGASVVLRFPREAE